MVDHLSRLRNLVFQLGLEHDVKEFPVIQELAKSGSEKNNLRDLNIDAVELRQKTITKTERKSGLSEKNDDDVFTEAGDDGPAEHMYVKKSQQVKRTQPVSKYQLNAPVVNQRLRKIKRPLEATRSMPLSAAVVPNYKQIQEQKFRADVDYLCAEMVSLRQKDQDIAKSLLKIYTEIQKLKLKKSCMQHQELLEEASFDAAEADDVPDMCDAPHKYMSKILSSRGVTKQNLAWRRFSCS